MQRVACDSTGRLPKDANNNEYTGLVGNAEILEQQRRDLDNLIKDDERKNSIKIEEEKKIKIEV